MRVEYDYHLWCNLNNNSRPKIMNNCSPSIKTYSKIHFNAKEIDLLMSIIWSSSLSSYLTQLAKLNIHYKDHTIEVTNPRHSMPIQIIWVFPPFKMIIWWGIAILSINSLSSKYYFLTRASFYTRLEILWFIWILNRMQTTKCWELILLSIPFVINLLS